MEKWMGRRICDMGGHAQKPATLLIRTIKERKSSYNIKLHNLVCNTEIICPLEHMERGKSFFFDVQKLK